MANEGELEPEQATGLTDMDPEAFRAAAHTVVDTIADYLTEVERRPVLPPVEPGFLRPHVPAAPPEDPEPLAAILADVGELVVPPADRGCEAPIRSRDARGASPRAAACVGRCGSVHPGDDPRVLWPLVMLAQHREPWHREPGHREPWHGHLGTATSASPPCLATDIADGHRGSAPRRAPPPPRVNTASSPAATAGQHRVEPRRHRPARPTAGPARPRPPPRSVLPSTLRRRCP